MLSIVLLSCTKTDFTYLFSITIKSSILTVRLFYEHNAEEAFHSRVSKVVQNTLPGKNVVLCLLTLATRWCFDFSPSKRLIARDDRCGTRSRGLLSLGRSSSSSSSVAPPVQVADETTTTLTIATIKRRCPRLCNNFPKNSPNVPCSAAFPLVSLSLRNSKYFRSKIGGNLLCFTGASPFAANVSGTFYIRNNSFGARERIQSVPTRYSRFPESSELSSTLWGGSLANGWL